VKKPSTYKISPIIHRTKTKPGTTPNGVYVNMSNATVPITKQPFTYKSPYEEMKEPEEPIYAEIKEEPIYAEIKDEPEYATVNEVFKKSSQQIQPIVNRTTKTQPIVNAVMNSMKHNRKAKLQEKKQKQNTPITPRVEPEDLRGLSSKNKVAFTQKVNTTKHPEYPQKLKTKTKNGTKLETTKQQQMTTMSNNLKKNATIRRIGFNDVLITPKNNFYKPYTVKIGNKFNKNFKSTLTNAIRQSISQPVLGSKSISSNVEMLNLTNPINSKIASNVSKMLMKRTNKNNITKFISQKRQLGLPPNRPAPARPSPPAYPKPQAYFKKSNNSKRIKGKQNLYTPETSSTDPVLNLNLPDSASASA